MNLLNLPRAVCNKQSISAVVLGALLGFIVAYTVIDIPPPSVRIFLPSLHNESEEFHLMEDHNVANAHARMVRITCMVMISDENHETVVTNIKATWGKRCNFLLFMTTEKRIDLDVETIIFKIKNRKIRIKTSWQKTKEAYKYVYENNYFQESEWFLRIDDNAYVILENLRYLLSHYSPSEPLYFGCRMRDNDIDQGYMLGGAGYVLSREAVRRLVESDFENGLCINNEKSEDKMMGCYLENAKVAAGNARDSSGRERFLPLYPEQHIIQGLIKAKNQHDYFKSAYYEILRGMNCCSDNAVSFGNINTKRMYDFEYLLYHLRPFGITFSDKLPAESTAESATSTAQAVEQKENITESSFKNSTTP